MRKWKDVSNNITIYYILIIFLFVVPLGFLFHVLVNNIRPVNIHDIIIQIIITCGFLLLMLHHYYNTRYYEGLIIILIAFVLNLLFTVYITCRYSDEQS